MRVSGLYVMPVMPASSRPARRAKRASSAGRMKRDQSCVPRGSRRRTYSAPRIACTYDFGLRLSVAKTTVAPGAASVAHARDDRRGIRHVLEHLHARHDREAARRLRPPALRPRRGGKSPRRRTRGRAGARRRGPWSERSMPVTTAPSRAMASDRMPPPHPTSSTSLPAMPPAICSIQSSRSGLISWSGRNSLAGSHQRCAVSENFASSAGSTLGRGRVSQWSH